ncbi:MAG: diacylglycerol/lipid kinase family protein [Acidobacteriaceae bacterium]
MYFYIVDPTKLNQKNFERVQNQLYSCLSEHRITGEVTRVTTLRTIPQLVEIAFSRGVKTLVAVGTDETLQEVINSVKDRPITLGYIPVMETELSRIFGLTDIESSAKTIASRRVQQLDLGLVNNNWFFTNLSFGEPAAEQNGFFSILKNSINLPVFEVKFSVDGKFSGMVEAVAGMVVNARDNSSDSTKLANPTDGILDILLLPNMSSYKLWQYRKDLASGCFEKIPGCSLMHLKKMEISSPEGLPLKTGGKVITKTPAIIEILPKALKMIVGRERTF